MAGAVASVTLAVRPAPASPPLPVDSAMGGSGPGPAIPSSAVAANRSGSGPTASATPPGWIAALICPFGRNDRDVAAGMPDQRSHVVPALERALGELTNRQLVTIVTEEGGACAALGQGHGLSSGMADLALAVAPTRSSDSRSPSAWMGVQLRGPLTVKVLGRVFTGDITEEALPLAPERETELVTAVAEALAYRRAAAAARTDIAPEVLRKRALDDLRAVDSEALAAEAPRLSAVIKQLRALLLMDGPCEIDSPLDLFRAAARLVPDSAKARTLVAVSRLKEAYEPNACTTLAERELQESLELEPWRDSGADNLGVLYELVSHARPPSGSEREVSTTQASRRLDTIWKDAAPLPPRALEMALAASFSSAVDRTTGAVAPGARIELSYGRDGTGFAARAGLSLLWTREVLLEQQDNPVRRGHVRWTRLGLDLGGRYRLVARPGTYAEAAAAVVIAPVLAAGDTFDHDQSSLGANFGGMAALRLGQRIGRLSLWLGLSASYFLGRDNLRLSADGASSAQLPSWDVAALGGMSMFFWL